MPILGRLLLLCVALAPLQGCLAGEPRPALVVFVPRDIPAGEFLHDLGYDLHATTNPSIRTPDSHLTMRDALGAPVTRIVIHHYPAAWGRFTVVADYITRLLDAQAEGGLHAFPYWAEGRTPEVFGTIEFVGGTKRPLKAAKGYLFFQDKEGRSWFGRYLGPDRERWVVPKEASPK